MSRPAAAPAIAILLACGGSAGPGGPAAPVCVADGARPGEATYYAADGDGACMFGPSPGDLLVAAVNAVDYDGARACGACAAVTGPRGAVTVRVVDVCPECPAGDLDLSGEAFARIAPLSAGRVPISWRYVSCEVAGPIRYRFKEGSNPFWLAVQVRDHANRVARLEAFAGAGWRELARADYNFFVVPDGLGAGPFAFRVTDVHGNALEDAAVPLAPADDSPGAGQFPSCTAP